MTRELELRDKLAGLLATTDDDRLSHLLKESRPEEAALLMQVLPIQRSNHLLRDLESGELNKVMDCLARQRTARGSDSERLSGMIRRLEGASKAAPKVPLCVRALDFVGQLFGDWTDQPASGGYLRQSPKR